MTDRQIPKRCSVDDNHPLARRLMVTLNGKVQHWVTAYDCDEGWVERYTSVKLGDYGKPQRFHGVVMVFLV